MICAAVFIEKALIVFLFPLGASEFAFIVVAVSQWLDKEHKEKIR